MCRFKANSNLMSYKVSLPTLSAARERATRRRQQHRADAHADHGGRPLRRRPQVLLGDRLLRRRYGEGCRRGDEEQASAMSDREWIMALRSQQKCFSRDHSLQAVENIQNCSQAVATYNRVCFEADHKQSLKWCSSLLQIS